VDFPLVLREHRTVRKLSQLELAVRCGTTQRHLSFIESGRSEPGRGLVLRLAESLELPLRERNELLVAAGYAPPYRETALSDPALAHVRSALEHILAGHLPYPAIVVDRHGDLVAANPAFGLITEGAAERLTGPGSNVYRLALHPDGIAPRVRNLPVWGRHIVERLRQATSRTPDERLDALRAELLTYLAGVDAEDDTDDDTDEEQLGFAVPLHLRSSLGDLHLLTTVTTFATAVDITLAELKLEAFLPADARTGELLVRRPPIASTDA
jgi:transcriptional regulator with XRE-family HTH domain